MAALFAPVAITPLLKIPLLLTQAVCSYQGMKPPTPISAPEERARFAKSDFMGRLWTPRVMVITSIPLRTSVCGLAALEAVAMLAQQLSPSLSERLPLLNALDSTRYFVTPLFLIGSAIAICGGTIRIYCHRALGRFFSWQMALQDDHTLITTGPYSFVRHPSYTGFLLLAIGNAISLLGPGSLSAENGLLDSRPGRTALGIVFGYLSFVAYSLCHRIPKEDEVLSREFGEQWQVWARKAPYKLIPYVY
ncbi:hypothetical protein FKP32DRAFT_1570163 [Trametes sanguinea]|nr:hypothetical protein FKP32DRAFT_1570163 [Trametes sanguinea]